VRCAEGGGVCEAGEKIERGIGQHLLQLETWRLTAVLVASTIHALESLQK
jgi:hypothetical protein